MPPSNEPGALARLALLALVPVAALVVALFPGLALPLGAAPRVGLVVAAFLAAGWLAGRRAGTAWPWSALIVIGPAVVVGGLMGLLAALRPEDLVVTGIGASAALAAGLLAAWAAAGRPG